MKPYVQIGFMPEALSTKPEPYQHHWTPEAKYDEIYTGWAYPPKDYDKWARAGLSVDEALRREVRQGARSSSGIGRSGTSRTSATGAARRRNFTSCTTTRSTPSAARLPTARSAGRTRRAAGGKFMRDFLEHCLRGTNYATGKTGTPLDFVSFHAKGAPTVRRRPRADGHRQPTPRHRRRLSHRSRRYPELKDKPIVIGESDPDGCAACQGPQLGYRNSTMYSSYTAASFAREYELADKHGVNLEGALTWAFEFEDQPLFAGFRALATNGIDLPVLNVFRMFGKMGGERVRGEQLGGRDARRRC